MREAILNLIEKLQNESDNATKRNRSNKHDPYMLGVLDGRRTIAIIAANALKEVLANAETEET